MKNVFDILKERGFIKQTIYEDELYKMLGSESVPFYIGFDPTADSLHIGHYIPIMAMAWMQRCGHKPIALFGGGTGMVGDPSGRSDMRQMLTKETISHNIECFKKQMSRFISFEGENAAIIANNADWLLNLNYVDFLRDIGAYFSVNKMLTAECFKQRMEKGLTFLEFNYMLMQGYDFLYLNRKYGCKLELGGDDQWSNMLAGVDLIRRKENKSAFCLTCTLLLNSEGKKDALISGMCGDNSWYQFDSDGVLMVLGEGNAFSNTYRNALQEIKDQIQKIEIIEGITGIGDGAFSNCSKIDSLLFPDGFRTIEREAFADCTSLEKIT
ncbi:MAG: tyrosine--tRNA ligase, partial [Clostridia bacterium]|nr:tyrosine--tRNA ligase [Clostridia bacterium]